MEIYLKYLDTDKMRGEVETFLFPVLHWAWPIVHWQLMFMSCLRSPLISWETVPNWLASGHNSGRSVFCVRSCTQEVNKQHACTCACAICTSSAFYTHPLHSSLGVHCIILSCIRGPVVWKESPARSSQEPEVKDQSSRGRWTFLSWFSGLSEGKNIHNCKSKF